MKRLNLPLISDTLFAGTCAFLLFFTSVRYYTKSAAWGLAFGIAAMGLFGALAYVYISGKQNKKLIISEDEKAKKLLALHLSLSSDGYIKNLFKSALGQNAAIRGKKIVKEGTAYFFCFSMQPTSEDDVAKVIKYSFGGKKAIFCNKIAEGAASLAAAFFIEITEIDGVYALLKQNNLLPAKYAYGNVQKKPLLSRIKSRFNRRLCAPLFWSGAALLALSYFAVFRLYYIISGCVLLALAAVALVINQRT